MSLFDLSSWFTGVDEVARGRVLDAQLADLNNADYSPGGGIYRNIQATQGTAAADNAWNVVQANLANQSADTDDYNWQVAGAFTDGAYQGLQDVGNAIKNPFSKIPLAWWIIGAAALFLYMGGAIFLKGRLAKK